jgi:hypothetical protein
VAEKYRRVFRRENEDGTDNAVIVEWDPAKPTQTFALEAEGYQGTNCLNELSNIEDIIGVSAIEEKPEMHEGNDEQDVFIVGFGGV